MANKQPQIVTIDGTEYEIDTLSDEVKLIIDHVADLDRKLTSIDFQRQQLQVGRDTFFALLKSKLANTDDVTEHSDQEG